jgi:hypothetical protein
VPGSDGTTDRTYWHAYAVIRQYSESGVAALLEPGVSAAMNPGRHSRRAQLVGLLDRQASHPCSDVRQAASHADPRTTMHDGLRPAAHQPGPARHLHRRHPRGRDSEVARNLRPGPTGTSVGSGLERVTCTGAVLRRPAGRGRVQGPVANTRSGR